MPRYISAIFIQKSRLCVEEVLSVLFEVCFCDIFNTRTVRIRNWNISIISIDRMISNYRLLNVPTGNLAGNYWYLSWFLMVTKLVTKPVITGYSLDRFRRPLRTMVPNSALLLVVPS